MKTNEFRNSFEIDRASKVPRATRKDGERMPYPAALTADGHPFNHLAVYFFFDGLDVRDSEHLRRMDGENLGSIGLRIVAINKLRKSRDVALADAQKHYLNEINACQKKIGKFENQKTPTARTMKFILMARDF